MNTKQPIPATPEGEAPTVEGLMELAGRLVGAYAKWERDGQYASKTAEATEHLRSSITAAREELRAYAQRLASAASIPHWQPIETAPKDGTRVMLTVEGYVGPKGPFGHQDSDSDIYHLARWTGDFWEPYIPNDWTHWHALVASPSPTEPK